MHAKRLPREFTLLQKVCERRRLVYNDRIVFAETLVECLLTPHCAWMRRVLIEQVLLGGRALSHRIGQRGAQDLMRMTGRSCLKLLTPLPYWYDHVTRGVHISAGYAIVLSSLSRGGKKDQHDGDTHSV